MRQFMLILSVAASSAVFAAQPVLTPGLWEISIRTEAPEVLPPMTMVVCITKEEAEDMKPPVSKPADDCKVTGGGRSGNVLSYTTKCTSKDDSSKVRFTYDGDRFEGVVEGKGKNRDHRQVYEGRRIGDCEELPTPPSR